MHRHNIKEVSGQFMEQWHQKLHNNATPDDIVICEAWLEFLRSDGNLDLFYNRLEQGGIPRKRLESYERPITSSPGFIHHMKDALIHDFEHFLGILREVHAGTDLVSAVNTARYLFDTDMHSLMDYILNHRNDQKEQVLVLLEKLIDGRRKVAGRLGEHESKVRDFIFLDLSLEDFFRTVVERNIERSMDGNELAELIILSLENLCLSNPDEEFASCFLYWKRLGKMPHPQKSVDFSLNDSGRLWLLQANAVVDRLQRGLGNFIDRYHRLIQPWAESLGNAFHADPWAINLFTEEVVRGRPAFVLSLLLRKFVPVLRKSADLSNWQIISPGHTTIGEVETVPDLKSIQGRSFSRPSVIVADKVNGDEEIPTGVAVLITSASVDVLSHLAVRARNAHILFAICYDPDTTDKLKGLAGRQVKVSIDKTGSIVFEQSSEKMTAPRDHQFLRAGMGVQDGFVPSFSAYALPINALCSNSSGGKSNNLRLMAGKLPDWIHIPESACLPFGVFEKVLTEPSNGEPAQRHKELFRLLSEAKEQSYAGLLEEIKTVILSLNAPGELISSLHGVMENSGLVWPEKSDDVWTSIKRVWA
jgi:alpha-glucan,water dikinase